LRYITISPQTSTIDVTTTQQFTALAYYSDGTVKDGSGIVTWASSNAAVATINASGVATGVAAGTVTITASATGTPGATATLIVKQTYTSIAVSCSPASVGIGATSNCTATGNPGAVDISTLVTWSSSNTAVATIPASASATPAVAQSVGQGSTNISATFNGLTSNNFSLTVTGPVPVSLRVSPAAPSVAVGGAVNFTAMEVWSDNTTHTPSGTVTWTSSATTTAPIIASSGVATGLAAGSSTITATENSPAITGNTTLTVVAGVTKFAYISNIGDGTIQWYTVTAANATPLVNAGTPVSLGTVAPVQTIVHPTGNFLYAIDNVSQVHVYTINTTTGQPTDTGLALVTAGQGDTNYGVIDPYGRFLYVIDSGGSGVANPLGTLFAFAIDPVTGALTMIGTGPIIAGLDAPAGIVIDRTGSYVYVTNSGFNATANANTVNAYKIDQATGALSALGTPSYPTGATPEYATIDPSGSHIYVANDGDGTVSGYSINTSTGALTPFAGGPTMVTGSISVLNLVIDPSGKYLYVLDAGDPTTTPITNGRVFGYVLNSDGTLPTTPITGTPQTAGGLPTGIAIDATGTLLAIDNSNDNDISLYTVGSGGSVSPKTPATVAAGTNDVFVTFYNAAH
jgi:6-phosphogluconolactonase (cycloisomerase 2 family)